MNKGDWASVNWDEFWLLCAASAGVGMIRFLRLLRAGKQVRVIDAVYEPMIAVFAGMVVWAIFEVTGIPDVFQAALTSLGAWGGPRTIHKLERKYFGGTRSTDFADLDEEKKDA